MHVLHITSDNNRTQNLINFYSNREKNYLAFSQFIYVIFQKTLNTCLWSLFAVFVFFIVWKLFGCQTSHQKLKRMNYIFLVIPFSLKFAIVNSCVPINTDTGYNINIQIQAITSDTTPEKTTSTTTMTTSSTTMTTSAPAGQCEKDSRQCWMF